MNKFILLFRGSEVYKPDQSAEALDALKTKMISWVLDLTAKGLHVASEPMQRHGRQVIGSERTVIDGAYGRESEIVGGCTIVLANDIDAAVDIARACPILETNATIEVREIQNVQ